MKNDIIKENIKGCSFYSVIASPNQTSIDNVLLFGIKLKHILMDDLYSYFDDVTFDNTCPFCNKSPIVCSYCKIYIEYCPYCGKQIATEISSLSQINSNKETLPYLLYSGDDIKPTNIIPGEYWQGEDLLDVTGAKYPVSYVGTKRFFDFLERHQYGPIIALPFQVDVSQCTDDQSGGLKKLDRGIRYIFF
jgi:hypothetical protein